MGRWRGGGGLALNTFELSQMGEGTRQKEAFQAY
jgi:hypothetical protein